ncbi:malonate decarboxylase holo-ACP synthase [Pseudalkalibacillus decolorationis]|uniref:malonate decarboxylase holo-ACP synthase n=1 Tax=Pseudalkalibacillus decolorationis TaxID=163879 RepID=UPI00214965C9|nr:malonate decarboxylase holo-ACP synthase [Pseudalkalibacillus decolorationis]
MVIKPHDLLRIRNTTELKICPAVPYWVTKSLKSIPFVVVRRAPIIEGKIPIGVRGKQRNQRFGAYIAQEDVIEHISPNQIVFKRKWMRKVRNDPMPALQALDRVNGILKSFKLLWGPTGSVGFEIASDSNIVTKSSDLDIIVYSEDVLPIEKAKNLMFKLSQLSVVVDVQIETPNGAISLMEYARNEFPILLRTKEGPKLVNDPSLL